MKRSVQEDQETETKPFPDLSTSPKRITVAFTLWEEILDKIHRKVLARKHRGTYNQTKAQWITDAILERLEEEVQDRSFERATSPRIKQFTIRIGQDILKRIQKHVLFNKRIKHPGYTRNEWLLEAIQKKLERDP